MTRTNLIVTHAAVFTVGIASAMVVNGLRNPQSDATATAENGRSARGASGSRVSGFSETAAGSRTGRDSREEGRDGSSRDSRPVSEKLSDIVRITDPMERQRALMDLIDKLGPDEFAGVLQQFREMDHFGDVRGEYDMLIRGWAKVDPAGALEQIAANGNSRWANSTVLSTWASTDPAAAERWATEHHEGDGPNPYMASVIRGIAATDVSHATELALSMPRSRERGEAVNAIADALFMQGTDAALAYPATITGDDAFRGGIVANIADRLAGRDPDRAATWLAAMDNGEIQNRASRRISEALAREDTAKAATWVKSLQPEAQAEAARGIIPIMSSSDIEGTARWVSSLAGTPDYNNVVEEFVWSCNTRNPEQSAAWIQGVSDPNQQQRLYHRMLGEWSRKDPAAVKTWVTSNNVPADVLRRFSR